MLGLEVQGVTQQQQAPQNRRKKGYGMMEHSICEDPSDESIGNNDNVGLHGDLPVSLCRRMVLTALGDKGSL